MINGAILKKEMSEILRTYRWWMIPLVFLFLAFSAPASVKFLPELLKGQLEAQNIKMTFPEPGPIEALTEYFKNLGQMGMLAVILLSMGLISEERSKGILSQLLAKPVSRASIVLSKFIVHGAYLALSVILSAGACFLYTLAIFGPSNANGFAAATAVYLLFLLLIFTVALFFSAILHSQIAAGGFALLSFFAVSIMPTLGKTLSEYSPAALSSIAVNIVQAKPVDNIAGPAIITVVLIGILLTTSIAILNKQEL